MKNQIQKKIPKETNFCEFYSNIKRRFFVKVLLQIKYYTILKIFRCGMKTCGPGKLISFTSVNHNKIYPHCCGGPVCRE